MKTIKEYSFSGKRAIVRVDFNVPLNNEFKITDDTRIRAALPTIKKILADGGSAILMSHLGRPKNGPEDKFSLKHLVDHLNNLLGLQVKFAEDCIGNQAIEMANDLKSGEVLLLENLRFYSEEKKGDEEFAKKLSSLADAYVNDAFGTAHRAHASTAIIAKFFPNDKMFGYLIASEIENINKVLEDVDRPYTAIMGGAKISGKIQIIKNLLNKVDNIIIGGGMMFTFIKAMGYEIGDSIVEDDFIGLAKELMEEAKDKGVNLHIPTDTIVADKYDAAANTQECGIENIPDGWLGLDIGKKSMESFHKIIMQSRTILWNGPMGVFEMQKFEQGTKSIGLSVAKATQQSKAFSLIGGGDSVAAINKYKLEDKVSYISTGGGALLEYMEGKALPGIQAILE